MNATEIRALRRKFILIAMLSFFLVIMFTAGMAELANQHSLRVQAGHALELIVENNGVLPEPSAKESHQMHATDLFEGLFPEFTYSARYFSAVLDPGNHPRRVDVSRVASVSEDEAVEYARKAMEAHEKSLTVSLLGMGQIDTFFYKLGKLGNGDTIAAFFGLLVPDAGKPRGGLYHAADLRRRPGGQLRAGAAALQARDSPRD